MGGLKDLFMIVIVCTKLSVFNCPSNIIFLGTWCLRQVIGLFTYKEAFHMIRTHVASYLMVYASVGAPDLTKSPEDYWNGELVDQKSWDIILNDLIAKDYENHVPKVSSSPAGQERFFDVKITLFQRRNVVWMLLQRINNESYFKSY